MEVNKTITISTDQRLIEFDRVCSFLQGTYWGAGRSPFAIRTSFENSVCFVALDDGKQIGFARVVTDHAFMAYIFDLFVFEEARGKGVAKMLMTAILDHPDLRNVSNFILGTDNAHALYRQFGFTNFKENGKLMVRRI
ncbi:GNAT family N-acetyltransferase [Lentilitoribacter sp. EG35]|uniref:GNAT family N-acetyltransferase n=1 Tax=Lentilitoribacter sp. EG35 TaxID=3234192 RepID=UPI003461635F